MKAYASKLFIFSHVSSKLQPCRDIRQPWSIELATAHLKEGLQRLGMRLDIEVPHSPRQASC